MYAKHWWLFSPWLWNIFICFDDFVAAKIKMMMADVRWWWWWWCWCPDVMKYFWWWLFSMRLSTFISMCQLPMWPMADEDYADAADADAAPPDCLRCSRGRYWWCRQMKDDWFSDFTTRFSTLRRRAPPMKYVADADDDYREIRGRKIDYVKWL